MSKSVGTDLSGAIMDLVMMRIVSAVLDTLALSGEPQTYGEVATILGLHPQDPNFYRYLDQTIAEDLAEDRPLRAALVVSKRRGLPSQAFFDKVRDMGVALPGFDEQAFWVGQVGQFKMAAS